ncbi:hypothetical protein [Mycobacterium sp. URHB0021]
MPPLISAQSLFLFRPGPRWAPHWAVWPAECRNRDVAHLIASFEWCPTDSAERHM